MNSISKKKTISPEIPALPLTVDDDDIDIHPSVLSAILRYHLDGERGDEVDASEVDALLKGKNTYWRYDGPNQAVVSFCFLERVEATSTCQLMEYLCAVDGLTRDGCGGVGCTPNLDWRAYLDNLQYPIRSRREDRAAFFDSNEDAEEGHVQGVRAMYPLLRDPDNVHDVLLQIYGGDDALPTNKNLRPCYYKPCNFLLRVVGVEALLEYTDWINDDLIDRLAKLHALVVRGEGNGWQAKWFDPRWSVQCGKPHCGACRILGRDDRTKKFTQFTFFIEDDDLNYKEPYERLTEKRKNWEMKKSGLTMGRT